MGRQLTRICADLFVFSLAEVQLFVSSLFGTLHRYHAPLCRNFCGIHVLTYLKGLQILIGELWLSVCAIYVGGKCLEDYCREPA